MTLMDMAKHMKSIILPEALEMYAINPILEGVSDEKSIRAGVLAFREFLHQLCGVLITDGDLYDYRKKVEDEHRSAAYANFPFIDNVKRLLLNIGIYGELTDDEQALICGNDIFNHKLSTVKNIDCLRFLTDCGISIDGIDLTQKKIKLLAVETVKISYSDNPTVLLGMKVMAIAEFKLREHRYHNILMRCDYRAIKTDESDVVFILKDIIKTLSDDVQNFVLQLHQLYQLHLDKGLKCAEKIWGSWIKVRYFRGKKEIWAVNTSVNRGLELTIKADNAHKYATEIEKLPLTLQEIIAMGHGCGRKRDTIGYCDAGCEGLRIPLDDSVLEIGDGINAWLDLELSCLRRK